tara:strand:+ start:499 stop:990 length:492 start_codon:yes stop_codon:yes gene_type:complete
LDKEIKMLKVFRIRPEAKLPQRAYQADAGMDLYYCPNGERAKIICDEGLAISARGSALIPTGLKVSVPYGHMLEIKNKSGMAYKRQLVVGACVVDPGYTGELYVNLHNIGLKTQYIRAGDKVAQAVLIPVLICNAEEVTEKEYDVAVQHYVRGDGGFGSTGNR